MPIVVKLDDMLHARRMTLTRVCRGIGITLANLSIIKTGKAAQCGSRRSKRSAT